MRPDNRQKDELRQITIQRNFTNKTPGSVLIRAGETMILCTASISEKLPGWMDPDLYGSPDSNSYFFST